MKNRLTTTLEKNNGLLRLLPTWVPRSFCRPGKRIKLHPDDYYYLGLERGGIDERWFASTTHADNGENTPENEGLSYIILEDGGKVTLLEAIDLFQDEIIGSRLWSEYGKWPMFSKFFDNEGPLPFHIHHRDEHANKVGMEGKPEMYFFPAQVNNHGGEFPFTFFGLNPKTTKEEVRDALKDFVKGDNRITRLARAFKLVPGTGWDVPPGTLHAPGSLCTYEPQFASDIYAMYESVLYKEHAVSKDLLWSNTPVNKLGDYDYLVDVIDWELNTDPYFFENRFMAPKPKGCNLNSDSSDYTENWICYKSWACSATELTIYPEQEVTITDNAAYGLILLQGYGSINEQPLETPTLLRFTQESYDEYFVPECTAKDGVRIKNYSQSEPLVMLKHFGPENPDLGVYRQ